MKKWFFGLLAAMMLLTSCGDTIPDESTNESSETSNGTEQSYRTLISVGKSYTAENVPACEEYPDFFGQQLTDGIKAGEGADYTETRAVGFKGNTTVTIDLGEDGFSYTYNEYLGESEECTVTITVK